MDVLFDPRDLISSPFTACPCCGGTAFGVLSISDVEYSRRCRDCSETRSYPLWPLKKKVIYIDQFAVSNMMKVVDGTAKGHDRTKADPFWLMLFELLERVCKLQLAICPYSEEHHTESLVSPFFDSLKRMYEQFSYGLSFRASETIVRTQLREAATAWLRNNAPTYDLDPRTVIHGGRGLHAWQDRFIVSVGMTYPDELIESIRSYRDRTHDGVTNFFQGCQASSEREYAYWFKREREASRVGIVGALRDWVEGRVDSSLGLGRFHLIRDVFRAHDVSDEDFGQRFREFMDSDHFKDFPASDIATKMWAVIAQKAANGQREPPNRGTVNDISIVSSLMPYCDAMLIDNKCRALLGDIPSSHALTYSTRLFSKSNGDAFIAFLRDIEREADPAILSSVHDLYGPGWPTPFLTMYDQGQKGTKGH